jgi:HemK-like putative methylase
VGTGDLLAVDAARTGIEDYLAGVARVVRVFGPRTDSHAQVFGVHAEGERFIVKHADEPGAVAVLENAVRFHAAVKHPVMADFLNSFTTPGGGLAVVQEWAAGEVLVDVFDPAVPERDAPGSPYARLRALPPESVMAAVGAVIGAHEAVTRAGFVAVDLYDGCIVYDFDGANVALIDLDHYRPGPYVLDGERQLGSTAFMAPEEFERGALIDERTTVFTLGRIGLVLLGCDRVGPADARHFRGPRQAFEVLHAACAPDRGARIPTVAALLHAWESVGRPASHRDGMGADVVDSLRRGGVVAAEDEAAELMAAAHRSGHSVDDLLARRLQGEPTAWIIGRAEFAGVELHIDSGVYVPRWKTEAVAHHAAEHLPPEGTAIDLCTGSGALAAYLMAGRPAATVIGTDIDPAAVECARANRVDARVGDLFEPLANEPGQPPLAHHVDLIVSVPPYVPHGMIGLLPRDVVAYEPMAALDGGADGLATAERIVREAPAWLKPGGAVVIEVGVDQTGPLAQRMHHAGLEVHQVITDGDGDPCGVCARRPPAAD